MSYFDPENLKVEGDERQLILPKGTTAKEALRMVYRGEIVLSPQQMRAAIESLPYETPKLSAHAVATMDGQSFAEALERATARSEKVRSTVINALPAPVDSPPVIDATVMKRPFQTYRRFVGRR
jgi:hypothetical protein